MEDHDPIVIAGGEGCILETVGGEHLIDAVSSLWCNVHGHRCAEIDAAVIEQLGRVAHVTTLGMAADVTEQLARRLADCTPPGLEHVFFGSDGASAVEAAMKMAFQYWRQTSDAARRVSLDSTARTKFLALGRAYHGDTTGATSLGGIDHFHRLFRAMLFEPIRGPVPCTYRLPKGVTSDQALEFYATQYEGLIADHAGNLAAVVMEPLVQGAAGMITHPVGLLRRIREACDRHDVLLIVDEVATGVGRTGRLFACEHELVSPDILCLGKGLTGGYLPLSAAVASPRVFEAFGGQATEGRQFFHGHTFAGNPLAAAAAIASLDKLDRENLVAQVDERAGFLREELRQLDDHPAVGNIRGRGLMFGIELVRNRQTREPFDGPLQIGRKVCDAIRRRGVWIRPLGDVILIVPPLVVDRPTLTTIAESVVESIEEVLPR